MGASSQTGGLALQRARGPSPQLGHIPPPLCFSCSPGPMEGQAVPTEPCQGCALTPTIHANPQLHPLQLLSPEPWQCCLPASALRSPFPGHPLLSLRRAGSWPRALQSTSHGLGTCYSDAEPGPASCPHTAPTPLPSALGPVARSSRPGHLDYLDPICPWGGC